MPFPAEKNIRYYVGDTYEFKISVSTKAGEPFNMTGYTPAFVISTERSQTPAWSVDAFVVKDEYGDLVCRIPPETGLLLTQDRYFYDIEIRKQDAGQLIVRTLLQGEIHPFVGVNRAV